MATTGARLLAMVLGSGLALGSAAGALAPGGMIQPGAWEMVSTTKAVEMPNAPPAIARTMAGRSITIRQCITAQQAASGLQELLKANKSCTYSRAVMTGGRIDLAMTCSQGGGTMSAVTTGTYTATSITSATRMTIAGPGAMTITSVGSGHRVGPC